MNRLRAAFQTILAEIDTPSSQRDQWFLWCAAQMAHSLIGAVLAGGLLFALPSLWAFSATAIGYALAKEAPDFFRAPGWAAARDCVQDALFVTAGAALAVAIADAREWLFIVAVVAAAAVLWWGAVERLARSDKIG